MLDIDAISRDDLVRAIDFWLLPGWKACQRRRRSSPGSRTRPRTSPRGARCRFPSTHPHHPMPDGGAADVDEVFIFAFVLECGNSIQGAETRWAIRRNRSPLRRQQLAQASATVRAWHGGVHRRPLDELPGQNAAEDSGRGTTVHGACRVFFWSRRPRRHRHPDTRSMLRPPSINGSVAHAAGHQRGGGLFGVERWIQAEVADLRASRTRRGYEFRERRGCRDGIGAALP